MRFAALGRTAMLLGAIRACREAGHELALVGTSPPAPESPVRDEHFAEAAREAGVPYFAARRLDAPDTVELLRSAQAEVAISVNWLTLVGAQARAAFPRGVINAHAGDLPRFRGNATPNWAILAGEDRLVVTLHEMVDALDAGPILLQRSMPLAASTYVGEVYAFLERAVPRMFAEALTALERGTLEPRPQSAEPAAALRCYPRRPADSEIDWSRPADEVGRLVRASAEPFAGAFTHLDDGRHLTVWRGRPEALPQPALGVPGQVIGLSRDCGEVAVLCGEGRFILEEVEADGERRGAPAALIGSLRERLGRDVGRRLDALRARVEELERRLGA